MPVVSIVIACRNESGYIERTLRALLGGTTADIEVIVVDGASTDGSREIVRSFAETDARVVLLDNPARVTPVAFNIGVGAAHGEYISILGAHSIPAPDWIERSLSALAEQPEAVAVGGVLETVSDTAIGAVIAAVMSSRFGVGNARFRTGGRAGYVDTVVFGCYRRAAFSHGLFDEELATNQDDEFNTRLLARGMRLYFDPSIRCRYYSRPTWRGMLRQYWRYGRYKMRVFRKAGRIGSLRQLAPALWVAFLAAAPWLGRFGLAVVAAYCATGLIASAVSRKLLFLPVAASLHVAYGAGFWWGLVADAFGPRRSDKALSLFLEERNRAVRQWLSASGLDPATARVLEVGCGTGGNLAELIRMGFDPRHLTGNDIQPHRLEQARQQLPAEVTLIGGDALELAFPPGSFDLILAFTIFTSLLDPERRRGLAGRLWELLAPGGYVLWYDFCYDNPRNPNVSGVPVRQIRELFPEAAMECRRLTLAPPLARFVASIHPALYRIFNAIPLLRTHVLCSLRKPGLR